MVRIVVDPELGLLSRDDILDQRPELEVVEPPLGDLHDELSVDEPVSFITGIKSWENSFLEPLSGGDWVATIGVGYDPYPLDEFVEQGIIFTHAPGVSAKQAAEHAMAMASSFTRSLWTFKQQQERREWKIPDGLTDLADEECCIVGLGGIGEEIAKRARAFDMTVRGVKRDVEAYDGAAHEVYPSDSLHEALSGADLVVLSVPLTDETQGLIGQKELSLLAPGSILVNIARGAVVQTDELEPALDGGPLAAACLDVTDPEPPADDSPLWDRDDVLITAHVAGTSIKYPDRFVDRYLDQYEQWLQGETLRDQLK